MPKLHVFDDDKGKLALSDPVIAALKAIDPTWELGFHEPIQDNCASAIAALVESTSSVCVIDAEIKADVLPGGIRALLKDLCLRISTSTPEYASALKSYQDQFGTHDDYAWAVRALAHARVTGVPALVISTKEHRDNLQDMTAIATSAGLPTIANWKTDVLSAEQTVRDRVVTAIANQIHGEWCRRLGDIAGRLWPETSLREPSWFNASAAIPNVPHDYVAPLNNADYAHTVRAYLDGVINASKAANAKINVNTYNWTPDLHESLKKLVGVCARVHAGGANERVPDMNTILLLAAAWDPNAQSWFSGVQWQCAMPLMPDCATRSQLRAAILALGGECGLFRSILVLKNCGDAPWSESASNVEAVTSDTQSITITLKSDMSKVAGTFNGANASCLQAGSGARNRLVEAGASLEANGCRLIGIRMTEKALIFERVT